MNPGILTPPSRFATMPSGLLGNPTPIPTPDQHYHAEASNWLGRVIANGGTVSHTTMLAVSRFCAFVEQQGLRQLFFRLNLFCGNDLRAALVPVFRGPSMSVVFGNATDTNFNFVSADYSQSNGLDAGASNASKHLRTGLSPNAIGTRNGHLSAYIAIPNAMTSTQYHVVSVLDTNLERYFLFCNRSAGTLWNPCEQCNWGLNSTSSAGTQGAFTGGHMVFSQDADSNISCAVANEKTVTNVQASTRTPLPAARDFFVFVNNNAGSPLFYLNQILRAYSIGKAMTAQQAAAYSIAMRVFQTALGRAV